VPPDGALQLPLGTTPFFHCAVCPIIAVLGSSRPAGNTRLLLDAVLAGRRAEVVDAQSYAPTPYDYQHRNDADLFLALTARLVRTEVIVLATPVYWYAMSAQMKCFFDRLSDLITIRKDLGRALAGRRVCLVATSTDPELPDGFTVPFVRTAEYFGLHWRGALHARFDQDGVLTPDARGRAHGFAAAVFGPRPPA